MFNTLTAYTGTDRSLEFNVESCRIRRRLKRSLFCEREHETPVSVTVLSEEKRGVRHSRHLSRTNPCTCIRKPGVAAGVGRGILVPYQMVEKAAASAVGDEFVLQANGGERAFRISGLYNGELYTPSQLGLRAAGPVGLLWARGSTRPTDWRKAAGRTARCL